MELVEVQQQCVFLNERNFQNKLASASSFRQSAKNLDKNCWLKEKYFLCPFQIQVFLFYLVIFFFVRRMVCKLYVRIYMIINLVISIVLMFFDFTQKNNKVIFNNITYHKFSRLPQMKPELCAYFLLKICNFPSSIILCLFVLIIFPLCRQRAQRGVEGDLCASLGPGGLLCSSGGTVWLRLQPPR